jgi:large subunit ribosomal protein L7A
LKAAKHRTVGAKQTLKALQRGVVSTLFIAADADPKVTRGLVQEARQQNVSIIEVETMAALGKACLIDVGAAIAAVLSE